jgi:hypothetical protein
LQNGNEVKGGLAQAGADTFTVTDQKTGKQTSIAYSEVAKVNGRGLSKWTKIGIVVGVAVVVIAVVGLAGFSHFDPFEHGILLLDESPGSFRRVSVVSVYAGLPNVGQCDGC